MYTQPYVTGIFLSCALCNKFKLLAGAGNGIGKGVQVLRYLHTCRITCEYVHAILRMERSLVFRGNGDPATCNKIIEHNPIPGSFPIHRKSYHHC